MSMDNDLLIESVRKDGKRFRPSDWIERISAVLASFDVNHRLKYAAEVQPCMIQGQKCLVVKRGLEQRNPNAFDFIMKFATDNELRIQVDRRISEREVGVERRG